MLKKLGPDPYEKICQDEVMIQDAIYPVIIPHTLEFNPPAHGTWNIVHIGMQMPQAHQIYVCGINCMRGVVLTAAEMGASERFSCVVLHEKEVLLGGVEDVTIRGTIDVINKLPKRPPAVLLFTVCVHHFLGCDLDYIYKKLSEAFPDIHFIRCFMDPIMQKEGPTPDQKLRIAMTAVLKDKKEEKDQVSVSLLGSNVLLNPDNDLKKLLADKVILKEAGFCRSFPEYEALGASDVLISTVPNGKAAAAAAGERLNKNYLHLPMSFDYEEIESSQKAFINAINTCLVKKGMEQIGAPDFSLEKKLCEDALKALKDLVGDTEIQIDYTLHPRPLGLARLLLMHGFKVTRVYLNAVSGEEEEAFYWLQKNAPNLTLVGTIHPKARIRDRFAGRDRKILALGQQAAWFSGSSYFVNMVEGGGLYGFSGIRQMCALMEDAFLYEKDTKDLVPRKGLGCDSCI